jgi:hypothetical protein
MRYSDCYDTATMAASLCFLIAGRRLGGVRVEKRDRDGGDGRGRVPGLPLHLRGLVGGRQAGRQQQGRSEQEQLIIDLFYSKYLQSISCGKTSGNSPNSWGRVINFHWDTRKVSRIRMFPCRFRVLDPGVKKALDPGFDSEFSNPYLRSSLVAVSDAALGLEKGLWD